MRRAVVRLERPRRGAERDHAAAGRLLARDRLGERAERETLGRAENVGGRRRGAGRSSGGRDENGTYSSASSGAAPVLGRDRLERRVARRRAGGEASQLAPHLVETRAVRGLDRDDAQAGLRQRPGLVEAERVDRGERLDRVQLLGERPAPRDAERGGRVGEAGQQDQALGDERDDARDRGRDRLVARVVALR